MTNTDMKKQAAALVKVLQEMGYTERLSPSNALSVVARLNGSRNWQTAQAEGNVGGWNAVQCAIYADWDCREFMVLEQGDDYSNCGDMFFTAVMDVAAAQPLSRVIVTLENWVSVANTLLTKVLPLMECETPATEVQLPLPASLAPAYAKALRADLFEGGSSRDLTWQEVAEALEGVRGSLYSTICTLYESQVQAPREVMVLSSDEGVGYVLTVGCPAGVTEEEAQSRAQKVMDKLRNRQEKGNALDVFDYKASEVLANLAKVGFALFSRSYVGPVWD